MSTRDWVSWVYTRSAPGAAILLVCCSAGPRIWTFAGYKGRVSRTVLIVPLATSSELGDQRTGVILSDSSRLTASLRSCKYLAESWRDGRIACSDAFAEDSALSQVEQRFALDQPITSAIWMALRQRTGADTALLFRPESASASHEVNRDRFFAPLKGSSSQNDQMSCSSGTCVKTENRTELAYVVSAELIDMGTGRVLRTGIYSDSASRTVPRNLGYAEAPPSEALLVRILVKLGMGMLTD